MNLHLDLAELQQGLGPIVDAIADAVAHRLRAEQPTDDAGRVLLSKSEAAESLGVSPSTVDRLRREAGLSCVKLSGLVLFRPDALRAWAAAKEAENRESDNPQHREGR